LKSLREFFPFSLIDAGGTVPEVQRLILGELSYQSSLELCTETFDAIQTLPDVNQIVKNARIDMVSRLDEYQERHTRLFIDVIETIKNEFIPVIKRHYLSGVAVIRTPNEIFMSSLAIDMCLDILSERGYHVLFDRKDTFVPDRIDPVSGKVFNRTYSIFAFQVKFKRPNIRESLSINQFQDTTQTNLNWAVNKTV